MGFLLLMIGLVVVAGLAFIGVSLFAFTVSSTLFHDEHSEGDSYKK